MKAIKFKFLRRKRGIWTIAISLLIITIAGCKVNERIFTVGVIGSNPLERDPTWSGFKDSMADSGYVLGENLKYIVKTVPRNDEIIINSAIKEILAQDVDMLLTLGGNPVDQRVKEVVGGTSMPVLFASYSGVKETGLVESVSRPGGNMTGVQGVYLVPRALEFFKDIVPDLTIIYVPYNPADVVSTDFIPGLNTAAFQLGIEVVFEKINSVEEAVAAVENLAGNVDAVFIIPSPTLNFRSNELSRAAIKRGLPIGSILQLQSDDDVLMTLSMDFYYSGKKLAIMARKILDGTSPADIPVETAEFTSIINLETADKIGLHIPEIALAQAKKIIR